MAANHKITRTSAPSTSDYGYKGLRQFTGPVAKRAPQAAPMPAQLPPADFGGVGQFVAGIQDANRARNLGARHSFERAATVGLVAGLAYAAADRHRRRR